MRIEFTPAEVERLADSPLPWFTDVVRSALGRTPMQAPDVDPSTGNLYYDGDEVGAEDVWFLDVLRAGWAYVDSDPSFAGLEDVQAGLDWAAWEGMAVTHDGDSVGLATAVMTYLVTLAGTLGVSAPS